MFWYLNSSVCWLPLPPSVFIPFLSFSQLLAQYPLKSTVHCWQSRLSVKGFESPLVLAETLLFLGDSTSSLAVAVLSGGHFFWDTPKPMEQGGRENILIVTSKSHAKNFWLFCFSSLLFAGSFLSPVPFPQVRKTLSLVSPSPKYIWNFYNYPGEFQKPNTKSTDILVYSCGRSQMTTESL